MNEGCNSMFCKFNCSKTQIYKFLFFLVTHSQSWERAEIKKIRVELKGR
jgi:hypothetical protein